MGNSNLENLTDVNGVLFFTANDGVSGTELWKSDGTSTGTVLVKDINENMGSNPEELTNVNGLLFFSATNGTNGRELWKSDGTEPGTVMVMDINMAPGNSNSNPQFITAHNQKIYFASTDGTHGKEIWVSDGTPENTQLVADINPIGNGDPEFLTVSANTLFFSANEGDFGHELWKLDFSTGVNTLISTNNVKIFPSPSNKILKIDIAELPKHLKLLNQTFYTELNVTNLQSGIYIIHIINSDGKMIVQKFIKQ